MLSSRPCLQIQPTPIGVVSSITKIVGSIMTGRISRTSVTAMAASLCFHATGAHAASDWCGVVFPTKDGFLNIRSGPGSNFPIINQAMVGSIVRGHTTSGEPLLPQWANVIYVFPKSGTPTAIYGYVNTRFVQEIDCNMLAGY